MDDLVKKLLGLGLSPSQAAFISVVFGKISETYTLQKETYYATSAFVPGFNYRIIKGINEDYVEYYGTLKEDKVVTLEEFKTLNLRDYENMLNEQNRTKFSNLVKEIKKSLNNKENEK